MSAKERAEDARGRLLQAADELFYAEGVNTVGIDRVIERAGVAKATLYSAFGSKEELIRAYLKARHEAYQQRMENELERRFATPKERLVGAFEIQGQSFTDPDFHGCPFISASAEARPGSAAQQESHAFRRWVHALFFDLAQQAGHAIPKLSPSNSYCCLTAPRSARGWTATRARRPRPAPLPQRWSTLRCPVSMLIDIDNALWCA